MVIQKNDTFALQNFEGPLDFLLNLIQREEIEIYDIPIQELIQQFWIKLASWEDCPVDRGAEFIGMASYLVWLKSKTLLPKQEQDVIEEEKIEDPHFEIIHHLIDYCRFKQAAKTLSQRQEQQSACFFRGIPSDLEWKKPMGINHLSLDDLSNLFKEMINRTPPPKAPIYEENWKVSDKIRLIKHKLHTNESFPLADLFTGDKSRLELIVIFLAVLELMKIGLLGVGKEIDTQIILIFAKKEGSGHDQRT